MALGSKPRAPNPGRGVATRPNRSARAVNDKAPVTFDEGLELRIHNLHEPLLCSGTHVAFTRDRLVQFAEAMRTHGCTADTGFADEVKVDQFRQRAADALRSGTAYVVVNYHRPSVGQDGPGHISPIGAYHPASDRFLIMDVAPFRYPFVWVSTERLYRGMAAVDADSGRSRGFVILGRSLAASGR